MLTPSQASSQSQNHNIGVSCDIVHEVQNLDHNSICFHDKVLSVVNTMYSVCAKTEQKSLMIKNIYEFDRTIS